MSPVADLPPHPSWISVSECSGGDVILSIYCRSGRPPSTSTLSCFERARGAVEPGMEARPEEISHGATAEQVPEQAIDFVVRDARMIAGTAHPYE